MAKSSAKPPLRIGRLSRETGASIRSIRHYDAHDLLDSSRSENGYRVFSVIAITQVKQIQRLITSGFNLDEISTFPECMRLKEGAAFCPETLATQRERLAKIENRIADLQAIRKELLGSIQASELNRPSVTRGTKAEI
ncbi:MerR family transcriptional regulator [Halomonas alkaliantarctica]|uniref:MerR family transcriptional regulator n=1 Tax=Halomonas alkaliantarctica TaxID=232346 RepID=A0ABY8LJS0_9GAMM|nr:MerR family transcriptional regulator [Halomonas alkaliantarctica]WGI24590.1 MerR family transcriptional regulator [Halomonas alkaliantarctica]